MYRYFHAFLKGISEKWNVKSWIHFLQFWSIFFSLTAFKIELQIDCCVRILFFFFFFFFFFLTGNTYNCDPVLNKCCTGCGSQEQFYACADIAITDKDDGSYLPDLAPSPSINHNKGTVTKPNKKGFPPKYDGGCRARSDLKPHEQFNDWCKVMCETDRRWTVKMDT